MYDVKSDQLEDIEFDLNIIAKYDCDLIEPNDTSNYSGFVDKSFGTDITKIIHNSVEYLLINELTTPDLFIDNTPCCLSAKTSYDLIRCYLKQNINNTWATLTDYSFGLTVKKNIVLQNSQVYKALESIFCKSKKESTTKYRDERHVIIYKLCPSPKDGYSVVTPFKGNNLQDLKNNIYNYLTDLIEEINQPLIDCPHCRGLGVINIS
jgi:hypothetical protein